MPRLVPYMEAPQPQKLAACDLLGILRPEDTISSHQRLASMASFLLVEDVLTVGAGSFDFIEKDAVLLDNIVIAPEMQGRKLGRSLVECLEQIALRSAGLDLEVLADPAERAKGFYVKLGYAPGELEDDAYTKTIQLRNLKDLSTINNIVVDLR